MRTDNGPRLAPAPFAGLSRLALWWMKLGIVPGTHPAGAPGAEWTDERMHLTTASKSHESDGRQPTSTAARASISSAGSTTNNVPHEALTCESSKLLHGHRGPIRSRVRTGYDKLG